ncbi:MAG: amino acid permease [Anaerolineae bacterium]|nr:amino acid permease [Gemmatimonadaceae bacterium]
MTTPSLRRELGLFSATVIVVSGIIGSGIFFTPSEVARQLGDARWILAVWAVGGLVALAGALTYAELGAMSPGAGGAYVYIRDAFGRLPAFLYGWMLLTLIATGATAAVGVSFGNYVLRLFDVTSHAGSMAIAVGTIVILTTTNCLGIKPGAIVQNALTIAKTLALSLLIAGGLLLWVRLGNAPPVSTAPLPRESLIAGLSAAFVPVLFTIGGWQQMNMVAGEIRDPQRGIPRALIFGIAIVITIYLGANAVYLRALGRDGLAASSAVAADTVARMAGPIGATFITATITVSVLGFLNVVILTTPRVFYAMAQDGVFLSAAARVHPVTGAPVISIIVMGAWSILLLLITGGDIGALLSGVVFADWIFFGLGAASLIALRTSRPDATRPYRVPGYPYVPLLFVLAACIGIMSSFVSSLRTSLLGTAILVVGVVLFLIAQRIGNRESGNGNRDEGLGLPMGGSEAANNVQWKARFPIPDSRFPITATSPLATPHPPLPRFAGLPAPDAKAQFGALPRRRPRPPGLEAVPRPSPKLPIPEGARLAVSPKMDPVPATNRLLSRSLVPHRS